MKPTAFILCFVYKTINYELTDKGKQIVKEFHCFTVHFNSLSFIYQLMHFYIQ